MALLFWDSFDHYAYANILEKYVSKSAIHTMGAFGRNGTDGLRLLCNALNDGFVRGPIKGYPDTVIVGLGLYVEEATGLPFMDRCVLDLMDAHEYQVEIHLSPDGALRAYRAKHGTLIGQSDPGLIHEGVYYYIETKVVIDNVAGSVEVKINGDTVIDESGIDTQGSANSWVSQFGLGGDGYHTSQVVYFRIDDVYVCDDSGAYCNDFLGDTRLCMLLPEGVGAHADWTPTAGANWQNVDENPPTGDTDYNHTLTATDRDSFEMEDLPGGISGTVHAVCAVINSRKDDAGTRTVQPAIRSGGTDYDGDSHNIPDDYAFHQMYAWETDPDTAAPWIVAGVNAVEAGYELVA